MLIPYWDVGGGKQGMFAVLDPKNIRGWIGLSREKGESLGFGLCGNLGIPFVWKPPDLVCVETSGFGLCGNLGIYVVNPGKPWEAGTLESLLQKVSPRLGAAISSSQPSQLPTV